MRSLFLYSSLVMVAAGQPGVHSVVVEGDHVVIRSAGIGLDYLGTIQDPPTANPAPRQFVFRIPRNPRPGPTRLPPDIVGVFLNGAPIYNRDWSAHAPTFRPDLTPGQLLGYALDGYPIYYSNYRSKDLDEFHGRETDKGYAYLATPQEYPYLLGRFFRGRCCETKPSHPLDFALPATMTLDLVHEKPMHLIVISDDFTDFAHLHPEPDSGWVYRAEYAFPRGGRYYSFRDYTPTGGPRRVDRQAIEVGRRKSEAIPPPKVWPQSIPARAEATLAFPAPPVLQPWLGAWAHAFAVREDGEHFLHLHAESPDGDHHNLSEAPKELRISANFPSPGRYRLWAQWQSAGRVETHAYVVTVIEGQPLSTREIPREAIALKVSTAGFEPARLLLSGPATLAVSRANDGNCAREIVFPSLGIRRTLPAGETTLVQLPTAAGEVAFSCGMGMYRGAVIAAGPK